MVTWILIDVLKSEPHNLESKTIPRMLKAITDNGLKVYEIKLNFLLKKLNAERSTPKIRIHNHFI